MNILVVEDNPSHLKLAHLVLSSAGHAVQGAMAAEDTYEAIKKDRPEVILLDLALPGIDGLELVARLKADPDTATIRIVAVTSYPELFPREKALSAGCDAYIQKPINTRTLSGEVEKVVKG